MLVVKTMSLSYSIQTEGVKQLLKLLVLFMLVAGRGAGSQHALCNSQGTTETDFHTDKERTFKLLSETISVFKNVFLFEQ